MAKRRTLINVTLKNLLLALNDINAPVKISSVWLEETVLARVEAKLMTREEAESVLSSIKGEEVTLDLNEEVESEPEEEKESGAVTFSD